MIFYKEIKKLKNLNQVIKKKYLARLNNNLNN